MTVTVKLYTPLRFEDGSDYKEVVLAPGATVEDALKTPHVVKSMAEYKQEVYIFALDSVLVKEDAPLENGQTISIILYPTGG